VTEQGNLTNDDDDVDDVTMNLTCIMNEEIVTKVIFDPYLGDGHDPDADLGENT
jgi:hypothetical protein